MKKVIETLREQERKDTIAKAVFAWPTEQSYFTYLIEYNLFS